MTSPRDAKTAAAKTAPAPAADPRDELPEHLASLRAFALSLTREDASADDLVQDTLVKAWTNIDKFEPGTNLKAWLFTILRNAFYSERRKHRREVQDSGGVHAAALVEKPAHDARLAFGEFTRAFSELSPEHREVLVLVGAEGFSYEEAAKMMGVARGTVKSRANRARARLAELMGLDAGEDVLADAGGATLAVISGSAIQAA
ncbi:RNA polymerase sigma factor [Solirhodobacter olei]|uniref:RNA polymerase sigma factor n=1 Tax=Solirhodobacter olei TaxID=2493082 RepID=UPI000FD98B0F|nr:RNA polymerase sigma factor [Solirhodobacter olei]